MEIKQISSNCIFPNGRLCSLLILFLLFWDPTLGFSHLPADECRYWHLKANSQVRVRVRFLLYFCKCKKWRRSLESVQKVWENILKWSNCFYLKQKSTKSFPLMLIYHSKLANTVVHNIFVVIWICVRKLNQKYKNELRLNVVLNCVKRYENLIMFLVKLKPVSWSANCCFRLHCWRKGIVQSSCTVCCSKSGRIKSPQMVSKCKCLTVNAHTMRGQKRNFRAHPSKKTKVLK